MMAFPMSTIKYVITEYFKDRTLPGSEKVQWTWGHLAMPWAEMGVELGSVFDAGGVGEKVPLRKARLMPLLAPVLLGKGISLVTSSSACSVLQ